MGLHCISCLPVMFNRKQQYSIITFTDNIALLAVGKNVVKVAQAFHVADKDSKWMKM